MELKFSISFEQTPLDHKNKYHVNLEEITIFNLVAKDEFFFHRTRLFILFSPL